MIAVYGAVMILTDAAWAKIVEIGPVSQPMAPPYATSIPVMPGYFVFAQPTLGM